MKKLLAIATTIILVLFTVNAMAASAVYREGGFVKQWKISDPGNASGFDNHIVFSSHNIPDLVIQASSVDFTTWKESLRCWDDPDDLTCPTVETDPILIFLNDIMIAGNVTSAAELSDLAVKAIYRAYWYEYKIKKAIIDSLAEMTIEELNDLQKRRALKFIYFGHGIDLATAQSIANDRITNGITATHGDLGLATIPLQDRHFLKLFSEVGWFE